MAKPFGSLPAHPQGEQSSVEFLPEISLCADTFGGGVLLGEPWILDVDTTVKPLYGRQEGAVVGYNPRKPGRPSHTYHSYAIAELRLILEVEVQAGNQHASKHSAPGLWALLARIDR